METPGAGMTPQITEAEQAVLYRFLAWHHRCDAESEATQLLEDVDWFDLAVGFFIGGGITDVARAYELATHAVYRRQVWPTDDAQPWLDLTAEQQQLVMAQFVPTEAMTRATTLIGTPHDAPNPFYAQWLAAAQALTKGADTT